MTDKPEPVPTITREEYQRLRQHDYAGPASSLEPYWREGWAGTHWIMKNVDGAARLVPVNLEEQP